MWCHWIHLNLSFRRSIQRARCSPRPHHGNAFVAEHRVGCSRCVRDNRAGILDVLRDPHFFQSGSAKKALEQLVDKNQAEGYAIRSKIRNGRPLDKIIAETEIGGYDLIVMGTRGRNRVARFLRPSTTEAVIRRSRCPVVAVRDRVIPEVAMLNEVLSMSDAHMMPSRKSWRSDSIQPLLPERHLASCKKGRGFTSARFGWPQFSQELRLLVLQSARSMDFGRGRELHK